MRKMCSNSSWRHRFPLKGVLVVKMIVFLTLLAAYQIHAARVYGQKITLKVQQTEIKNILHDFEKQADVRFLYNYDLSASLHEKVDFTANNLSFELALDRLFQNTGLSYRILEDRLVVILKRGEETAYQSGVITGVVMDESQQPLGGVTMTVKGTNNGVSTDEHCTNLIKFDATRILRPATIARNLLLVVLYLRKPYPIEPGHNMPETHSVKIEY